MTLKLQFLKTGNLADDLVTPTDEEAALVVSYLRGHASLFAMRLLEEDLRQVIAGSKPPIDRNGNGFGIEADDTEAFITRLFDKLPDSGALTSVTLPTRSLLELVEQCIAHITRTYPQRRD